MGNVLAQPVRVPVDPLADLPGVVQKDSLGAGLSLMPRLGSPGTPLCSTGRVGSLQCFICIQHVFSLLWSGCTKHQGQGVAVEKAWCSRAAYGGVAARPLPWDSSAAYHSTTITIVVMGSVGEPARWSL